MGESVNGSAVMMEKDKDECCCRKLDAFMTSKFGEEWLNFIPPPEIPEKIKQIINIYRQPNIFQLRNGLEFCSVPDGFFKDCYITQKNSPVDFYVQTQQMIQTVGVRINQQIDELVQEGRLILFKKPKEGDICLAPSDDDDDSKIKMLFRGEILKISSRGYLKIFFMDFGGVARVFPTSIYQMPEELKKLPKLAVRAQWAMTLCDEVAGDEKKMEFDLLGSVEGHYDVYFKEKISEGEYLVDFGRYKSSEYAEFIIHDEIKKYDDLYFIEDSAMSQQDAESVFTIVEDKSESQLKEIRRSPPPIEIFSSSSVSSVKENIKPMKKMDNNVLPIHVNAQVIMPEALVGLGQIENENIENNQMDIDNEVEVEVEEVEFVNEFALMLEVSVMHKGFILQFDGYRPSNPHCVKGAQEYVNTAVVKYVHNNGDVSVVYLSPDEVHRLLCIEDLTKFPFNIGPVQDKHLSIPDLPNVKYLVSKPKVEEEYLVDFGRYKSSEYAEFVIHDEIKKYDDLYFIEDMAMSQQDAESVFTIVEDRQLNPPPIEIFSSSSVTSVKENIKPMKKMDNNVLPIHVNAQVIMPEALVGLGQIENENIENNQMDIDNEVEEVEFVNEFALMLEFSVIHKGLILQFDGYRPSNPHCVKGAQEYVNTAVVKYVHNNGDVSVVYLSPDEVHRLLCIEDLTNFPVNIGPVQDKHLSIPDLPNVKYLVSKPKVEEEENQDPLPK